MDCGLRILDLRTTPKILLLSLAVLGSHREFGVRIGDCGEYSESVPGDTDLPRTRRICIGSEKGVQSHGPSHVVEGWEHQVWVDGAYYLR